MTLPGPPGSQTRPEITVRLPSGWTRAALSGVEAALLGWVIPALIGLLGLASQSLNPWLMQVDLSAAAALGTNFWSLSLGAPMSVGGLPISLIPLGWTLIQVVLFRLVLLPVRSHQPSAIWFAVPTFVATVVIVLALSPGVARTGPVALGALLIALVATTWAFVSQNKKWPKVFTQTASIWRGLRVGFEWLAVLAAVGFVAVTVAFIASFEEAGHVRELLGAAGVGTGILGFIEVSYLPTFMAWALAWLAGPGFVLSGGSISSPTSVATGELPLFPVAQMVPTTAPGDGVVWLMILGGLTAGLLTGLRQRRRPLVEASQETAVALAFFAGAVGIWFALATGSLGNELMSHVGPTSWAWPLTVLEFGLTAGLVAILVQPTTLTFIIEGAKALGGKLGSLKKGSLDAGSLDSEAQ